MEQIAEIVVVSRATLYRHLEPRRAGCRGEQHMSSLAVQALPWFQIFGTLAILGR